MARSPLHTILRRSVLGGGLGAGLLAAVIAGRSSAGAALRVDHRAPSLPAAGLEGEPPLVRLAPEGGLSFDVRDARTGEPIPCKLTLVGVGGTKDPELTRNDIGRPEGDAAIAAYNRVMSVSGVGAAHVPFGTYDVTVSRGPEWDATTIRGVSVGAAGAVVRARLEHVVDTHGWLSADFHVHAARSSDSRVPMLHRVIEFVSDDVQMIVATDHNVLSDYAPFVRELGAGRYIATAVGDELTTGLWGHFGAFPLHEDPDRVGQGAVLVHGRQPADFFGEVHARAPGAVIDVHHPRMDAEIGYFDVARFDSRDDRAQRPGFSWSFDAIEVMNGYEDPIRGRVDRLVEDWFALLDHGHLVTATGNSDTHHLRMNIGGYPRNYVRVLDDRPASVDGGLVAAAVRAHHAFFTTAPFVSLRVNGGDIGDLAPARDHHARAEITVQAAPWVSVDRVVLYVNGRPVKRWDLPSSGGAALRFRDTWSFDVASDSYVVARVEGDRALWPVVGDRNAFAAYPFALTNPVFLDTDGDGRYGTALARLD